MPSTYYESASDVISASSMIKDIKSNILVIEGDTDSIEILDEHVHNNERWYGKSADQSGNDWAADNFTAFVATSGDGAYGTDANDVAKILGSADTPAQAGMLSFDFHRLLVTAVSVNSPFKLRIAYGTTTQANAIAAGQYSEVLVMSDDTTPQRASGEPFEITTPRVPSQTLVWIDCKNVTNNATISFFVGIHEYNHVSGLSLS